MGETGFNKINDFLSRNMEMSSSYLDRFKDMWADYPNYRSQIGGNWFSLMQQSFECWKAQQESLIKLSSQLLDEFANNVNKVLENSSQLSNTAFDNIVSPTLKGFLSIYQPDNLGNKTNVVDITDGSIAKPIKDASKKVQ